MARVEDLWKALQEPAVLSSGEELTPDLFMRLVDEAGAEEDVARWLKELPGAADLESFLNQRPPANDEG